MELFAVMAKIIGLDVGDARVGIALGDDTVRTASPFKTVSRGNGAAEREILELIQSQAAQKLVVGLPLSEDGAANAQCEKVKAFCRRIERRSSVKIHYVDEYLSSVEAEEKLKDSRPRLKKTQKIRSKYEKGLIDAVAASIILQSFLDSAD